MHEFYSTVTRPRYSDPPSTPNVALSALDEWLTSPSLRLLGERADHYRILARLLRNAEVIGARVHDARIAAICLSHGVDPLWTADRDFSLFPELRVVNPLEE